MLAIINFVNSVKRLMVRNNQVHITRIVSEYDYVECGIFNEDKPVSTFKLKYAAGLPYNYRFIVSNDHGNFEPLKRPSDFFKTSIMNQG